MYSTGEAALARVTKAIDELDAKRRDGGAVDLDDHVAAVWALVASLYPGLAKAAAQYSAAP